MEYCSGVIIACTSCPAQYSVPDAKVLGKKVRVTCKHCGTGIIVDGTGAAPVSAPGPISLPEPMAVAPRVLAPFDVPRAVSADDDATQIMRRPASEDYSVHEEPTVIGQIPREALEAERRFASRTEPPPTPEDAREASAPSATPLVPPPAALPHDVPEGPLDATAHASPQALRVSASSLPPQPQAEIATLLSQRLPRFRPRRWPWVLGIVVLLTLLIVISRALR